MENRANMRVYGGGNLFFFLFFAIVLEISSPKHHEIQEFGQTYHISTMKFSKFSQSTALLQVHYNISFEVMSQRFNNYNIVVEQGCASIKKHCVVLIFIAEKW
jgi:hypothetical protein